MCTQFHIFHAHADVNFTLNKHLSARVSYLVGVSGRVLCVILKCVNQIEARKNFAQWKRSSSLSSSPVNSLKCGEKVINLVEGDKHPKSPRTQETWKTQLTSNRSSCWCFFGFVSLLLSHSIESHSQAEKYVDYRPTKLTQSIFKSENADEGSTYKNRRRRSDSTKKEKYQKSAVIERLTLNFHDIFLFTLENSFYMPDVTARVPFTSQHLAQ